MNLLSLSPYFLYSLLYLLQVEVNGFIYPRFAGPMKVSKIEQYAHSISKQQATEAIVRDSRRITAIYLNPNCPYCKKVLAFAESNQIDFDKFGIALKYVVTEGGQPTEYRSELLTRTGKKTVPAIEIDGFHVMFESADIMEMMGAFKQKLMLDEQIRRLRAGETQKLSAKERSRDHTLVRTQRLLSEMTKEELLAEYHKIKRAPKKAEDEARWSEMVALMPNELLAEVPDWAMTESMLKFHSGQLDAEGQGADEITSVEGANLDEDEFHVEGGYE